MKAASRHPEERRPRSPGQGHRRRAALARLRRRRRASARARCSTSRSKQPIACAAPRARSRQACEKLLANTVIENYRVELADRRAMKAAVIVFPGSNREGDVARALGSSPAQAPTIVWHADRDLPAGTDLVVLPGGFSYGDYLRCGAIAARAPIMDAVRAHAARGGRCSASATASRSCARRPAARRADAQREPAASSAAMQHLQGSSAADTPFTHATTRPAR